MDAGLESKGLMQLFWLFALLKALKHTSLGTTCSLLNVLLSKLNSFNSKKTHATCIPFLLKSALDKRTGTLYAECLSIYVTDDTNTLKPINCVNDIARTIAAFQKG